MNIAIIGYGKMGQLIEKIAIERGHKIVSIIDANNTEEFENQQFASADVALEFSTPQTAVDNIRRAWQKNVKIVSGTTGWNDQQHILLSELKRDNKTLFWASNFSLGVNLFWEINRQVSQLMSRFPQYQISIEETHHIHKKDAPSGTAVTLAENLLYGLTNKEGWTLMPDTQNNKITITSIREGEVFGKHTTICDSSEDIISITHNAKSRKGFALGAVVAAEFLKDKNGYFTMKDLLQL